MKYNILFLFMVVFLVSCGINKKLARVDIKNQDNVKSDSVEYELIIFDPGFDAWYVSNSKPIWYHSKEYYETWNHQYVVSWNSKAISSHFSKYFETTIDYDFTIDYGSELNHKLFYYFQYVEKVLKINILPAGTGPKTAI